ncbi:uracil-DNA glycosylase [Mycoplasmopsis gallinarum]|uniref:uracil-DNA glycosylase n=1 Tax=Mycoplasmopsis gallinarum TaxID=29557 RepID=UPI000487F475|nr:uracil-DNA glycosylase [Mycoplasmopsis gallinarum]
MVYQSWLEALNLNDENELLNLIEKIYHKLEAKSNQISPKYNDLIKLMKIFDLNKTKVIILGQDPYPTINQADGIAFSSSNGKLPKSLKNIFVELKKDYPLVQIESYNLTNWLAQGILLLNIIWTVDINKPLSHKNEGWEELTQKILEHIIKKQEKILIFLFGKKVQDFFNKNIVIKETKEIKIVELSHPSPLSYSRGKTPFKDSQIFKLINQFYEKTPINFDLKERKQ